MDGGKRGQVVNVCADLSCRVHHPDTPSPQQIERQRAEERKRIEKDKLAITTRHRILAAVLEWVSEPLKKADLLIVAHHLVGHLPHSQVPILAKRHKIENDKKSNSPQELLAKRVTAYDEAALCRILLEISLLESAYGSDGSSEGDILLSAAKRYRINSEKVAKDNSAGVLRPNRRRKNGRPRQTRARRKSNLFDKGGEQKCLPPFVLWGANATTHSRPAWNSHSLDHLRSKPSEGSETAAAIPAQSEGLTSLAGAYP